MSHTPGPWYVGFGLRIVTESGKSVALCAGDGSSFPVEQNKANANLIASAPDMQLALQGLADALLKSIEGGEADGFDMSEERVALHAAKAFLK